MVLFVVSLPFAHAEQLTPEENEVLYQKIMALSGQSSLSLADLEPEERIVKSATPYILNLSRQVRNASPKVQQAWASLLQSRYDSEAPDTLGSPDGNFLIHYAKEGPHAARVDEKLGVDPVTGRPLIVDSTAEIFDSSWSVIIGELGFKQPPSDSFYASGGDRRFDVYMVDLGTIDPIFVDAYGLTYRDSIFAPDFQYATSFMLIDNDYDDSEFSLYKDNPLDAIRVTAAHEFFHAVQFGYDALEPDYVRGIERHHWLEMSSVWMEDQVFDDVNDYYYYTPSLLSYINLSLQAHYPGLHQYGAGLWPHYLSQTFGRDIVRRIWELCEATPGANVFQNGFQDAIDEFSAGEYTFQEALSEFFVWCYFTGERARPGYGFAEAANFRDVNGDLVQVPDSIKQGSFYAHRILNLDQFPVQFNDPAFRDFPDSHGGLYVRFSGLEKLDSTLTIGFSGDDTDVIQNRTFDVIWNNRIIAYNPHIPSEPIYIDSAIYPNSFDLTVSRDIIDNYDEVILVTSPFIDLPKNYDIGHFLQFSLNVSDSSEPISQVEISDAFPNPMVMSESDDPQVLFKVLQPEPEPIKVMVYTLAGELVFELEKETNKSLEYIGWNGQNMDGETVASGMYIVYITAGETDKVAKVAIIE